MKQTKYLGKGILFFYLFSLLFLELIGCGQTQTDIDLSNNGNNTSKADQEKQGLDIDSFYNLKEHIIQRDLNIEREVDTNDISLNVDGKYDLNKDGEVDSIEVRLIGRKDSQIRVNESEILIKCDNPVDFYLVDLVKDDKFIYNPIDYNKYLVGEYSFTADFEGFFIEQDIDSDFSSQEGEFIWDDEKVVKFKKDQKIKIIAIDEQLNWYGIELQDGTTGILYFWIGD